MPNVLFLIADELSWWGLGHMNPRAITPNLDRLAERGRRFDAAYTPSPICVPARAAIAAGRPLHEIGYWSSAEAYDGRVPGWGHALQAAGMPCVSFGKLHYRNGSDATGFDRQIEPIHIPDGIGWVRALMRRPLCAFDATAEMAEMIGPGETDYQRFDMRVADEACSWLAEPARRGTPWCAFVSMLSPHYPLMAPEAFYRLYDPAELAADAAAVPDHPILRELTDFFDHDRFFTAETRGVAAASYFGLCSFLDAQMGRVLDALSAAGLAEETLVIFTADHGEMLGEKGFWGKSSMYESSARVPLILAGPGVAPGVEPTPVSLLDIAPTITAAMGAGGTYPGSDLRGRLDPDRSVVSEYHDGGASAGITMLRWTDAAAWKLVHYAEGHPPQLFNLTEDPQEEHDLARSAPAALAEGYRRLNAIMDPEAVNERAHADQARRIEELGGRDALLAIPQWSFTPADSR